MPRPQICLINADKVQTDASLIYFVTQVCDVTRCLERLYGRKIAQKYFTSHITFDKIKLTSSLD